jgi:hypothetical protein
MPSSLRFDRCFVTKSFQQGHQMLFVSEVEDELAEDRSKEAMALLPKQAMRSKKLLTKCLCLAWFGMSVLEGARQQTWEHASGGDECGSGEVKVHRRL